MFIKLNYLVTSKHIFTLLALGLVLAVCSGQVQALEVEFRTQTIRHYMFIDEPGSSVPPEQLSFPFSIYIYEFRAGWPGFPMQITVSANYDVSVSDGSKGFDKEGIHILSTYREIMRNRRDTRSVNDGENKIIPKNWDDCVNFLEAFTRHCAPPGSSYVIFYEGEAPYNSVWGWAWDIKLVKLKAQGNGYDVDNRPNNTLKLPVDELRDFLTGQGKWTGWKPPKQGPDK